MLRAAAVALVPITLVACSGGGDAEQAQGKGGPGGDNRGPTEVGYVVVQPSSVPLSVELAGRTAAYEQSEVRPQVSGIIQRRLFTEGTNVRAGQVLYEIDPRLYRAAAAQARASVESANATAEAARTRANRLRPLADLEAVSQQEFTDAQAQAQQASAAVSQSQAQLESAQINLRFTRVTAPISGRIGRSLSTVGALVTASQADPLAVIQRLDPIFVDIQESSADLLALRRSLSEGGVVAGSAAVKLRLEDGSDYGHTGRVEFAEAVVNEATGTVTLRARFPNPDGLLLPGMFVRATIAQSVDERAFLVPQQGVSRDPRGRSTVMLVGPGNKAVQRQITASRVLGSNWVVTSGLNAGDKVIVEGTAKARPGQPVRPVPAGTPNRLAPPGGGAGAAGAPAGESPANPDTGSQGTRG